MELPYLAIVPLWSLPVLVLRRSFTAVLINSLSFHVRLVLCIPLTSRAYIVNVIVSLSRVSEVVAFHHNLKLYGNSSSVTIYSRKMQGSKRIWINLSFCQQAHVVILFLAVAGHSCSMQFMYTSANICCCKINGSQINSTCPHI